MTESDAKRALTQVPSGMAAKLLNIEARTLRRWYARGKIKATRTASGRWLWDISSHIALNTSKNLGKGA